MKKSKTKLGRPPMKPSAKRVKINTTLPAATIHRARLIGDKNASRGIEIAVAAYPWQN